MLGTHRPRASVSQSAFPFLVLIYLGFKELCNAGKFIESDIL